MKTISLITTALLLLLFSTSTAAQSTRVNPSVLKNKTVRINPKVTMTRGTRIVDMSKVKVVRPTGTIKLPDRANPGRTNPTTPEAQPEPTPQPDPDAYLELEREGPNNIPFHLEDNFSTDVELAGNDLLSLYSTVFRDGNIKSGYYYYLPNSYNLGWSSTTKEYDFNVTYGIASQNGPGRTTVTAILHPGLKSKDVEIARNLLKMDIKGKPEAQFEVKELIPLPMAQSPVIEFTNLSQFGVQTSDISLRAPSDLSDPILLSFTTDQIDALMAMFFNNIGLYGDVIVYPAGEGMPESIRIPFNLKIDASETFGHFQLQGSNWREEWSNLTDYPVYLNYLHVLRRERTGYQIYSWKTDEIEVPEGAKVDFNTSTIPAWIDKDRKVERIWMEYAIGKCNSCNKKVKEKILGSIPQNDVAKPEKLEFTILTPMAFTEASLIRIKVRSFQATAAGEEKQELPSITVNEDGDVLDGGTLYVRDGKVDFEYRLQVYLEDGTKYESGWIQSSNKEVVIGSRQIKDNIPEFAD